MRAKSNLRLVKPTAEKRAVAPVRRPNADYRKREHMTPGEVENRPQRTTRLRDATMIWWRIACFRALKLRPRIA